MRRSAGDTSVMFAGAITLIAVIGAIVLSILHIEIPSVLTLVMTSGIGFFFVKGAVQSIAPVSPPPPSSPPAEGERKP